MKKIILGIMILFGQVQLVNAMTMQTCMRKCMDVVKVGTDSCYVHHIAYQFDNEVKEYFEFIEDEAESEEEDIDDAWDECMDDPRTNPDMCDAQEVRSCINLKKYAQSACTEACQLSSGVEQQSEY